MGDIDSDEYSSDDGGPLLRSPSPELRSDGDSDDDDDDDDGDDIFKCAARKFQKRHETVCDEIDEEDDDDDSGVVDVKSDKSGSSSNNGGSLSSMERKMKSVKERLAAVDDSDDSDADIENDKENNNRLVKITKNKTNSPFRLFFGKKRSSDATDSTSDDEEDAISIASSIGDHRPNKRPARSSSRQRSKYQRIEIVDPPQQPRGKTGVMTRSQAKKTASVVAAETRRQKQPSPPSSPKRLPDLVDVVDLLDDSSDEEDEIAGSQMSLRAMKSHGYSQESLAAFQRSRKAASLLLRAQNYDAEASLEMRSDDDDDCVSVDCFGESSPRSVALTPLVAPSKRNGKQLRLACRAKFKGQTKPGENVIIPIKSTEPLQVLLDKLLETELKLPAASTKALIEFDGMVVDLKQTPNDYDMEDEDLLDILIQATEFGPSITLKLRSSTKKEVVLKHKMRQPFQVLLDLYKKQIQATTRTKVILKFDGDVLDFNKSPAFYDMENGDLVDAFVS